MKNFVLFIILIVGYIGCVASVPPPDNEKATIEVVKENSALVALFNQVQEVPGKAADLVISVDQLKEENRLFASLSVAPQDEPEPPDIDIAEVMNVPGKDEPIDNWINWGLKIGALLVFEIIQRRRKTEKSWSILGMLYRAFNTMVKDKAADGGNLEIQRE